MVSDALLWVVVAASVGGVIEFVLAVVAYFNRERAGSRAFGWLVFAAGGWSFLQLTFILTPSERVARTAFELTTAVSHQVAMLWFVFAVVYTGRREWLTPRRVGALWTPLTAYLCLRWTEQYHGLTRTPVTVETVSGITAPTAPMTPAGFGSVLLSYGFVLAGFALLVSFLVRSENVYRRETAMIVVGALFPTVGTVAFTAGYSLHPGVSLVPQLFVINGVVTALALFRYDFLSVGPVATDMLAEEIDEPVLVLDDRGTVVDHNPAATRLSTESLHGRHVEEAVPGLSGRLSTDRRIMVEAPGYDRAMSSFSLQVRTVDDQFGVECGRLVHFRDVSTQQRRLDQLTAMQAATQEFIGARTTAEVADIAVGFAGEVHDQAHAALFRYEHDEETLVSAAMTDELVGRLGIDGESLTVSRGSGPLWKTFDEGKLRAFEGERAIGFGSKSVGSVPALFVPLGDHGVLVIGTDDRAGYTETDRQLAQILARTIETALTRVEHEGQLRASRVAVERRTEQIEFFNGVLRHNIRNAMLVVDGHAEHLQSKTDSATEADKLDTIREWCRELMELTETVRAVNDTVTASEDERLEHVDISTVLREQVADLADRYDGVAVDLDVDDSVVVVANHLVGDVLSGVLTNAVEHNDSPHPRVTVSTDVVGEWAQVKVADNGPGLSEEMQTQVFQREMATTDTAHGFGLYFVSVMMDLYNGKVWFENGTVQASGADETRSDGEQCDTVVVLEFRLADESLTQLRE